MEYSVHLSMKRGAELVLKVVSLPVENTATDCSRIPSNIFKLKVAIDSKHVSSDSPRLTLMDRSSAPIDAITALILGPALH
jgi:hypothetical protein